MGLAAAKAKGAKLGDPNIKAAQEAAVAAQAEPDRAANNSRRSPKFRSPAQRPSAAIAPAPNARGAPHPRGGIWRAMSVRNVLARR